MPRRIRQSLSNIPQHLIQRGNDRQPCFKSHGDMAAYSHWLHKAAMEHEVRIHAWVFMTNHVHLLATPMREHGLSLMMQELGRRYVRYFNSRYERTGTLWEGRFKSCLVQEDDYFLICQRYIESNPVRAGMVSTPDQYHWSSYHANALGVESKLRTAHRVYMELGRTDEERQQKYCALFSLHLDHSMLNQIRTATNRGFVLGGAGFRDDIERKTGQRMRLLRRGPKAGRDLSC